MDPIDKFLKQYSYKFPKGYPDMKNEQDILLMESLLNNLGISLKEEEKNYDDEILNLLTSLSDDESKKKVVNFLNKINSKEDKEDEKLEENITKELNKKNITGNVADQIIFYADKANQLDELSTYMSKPTVNHSDLLNNNNLLKLFSPIPLSDTFKDKIIGMPGAIDHVTFGKGELALIIFLKDAVKYKSGKGSEGKSGDIGIDGHVLEVKRGKSIMASANYISRAKKVDLFNGAKSKKFIEKYNIDLKPGTPWVKLFQQTGADKTEIEDLLTELYPGLKINVDISTPKSLNDSIGLALAEDYLKNKDLLFINDQNNYICIESFNKFKEAIENGILVFQLASDINPRCYLA
jgi:hypothetical protein